MARTDLVVHTYTPEGKLVRLEYVNKCLNLSSDGGGVECVHLFKELNAQPKFGIFRGLRAWFRGYQALKFLKIPFTSARDWPAFGIPYLSMVPILDGSSKRGAHI